MKKVQMVFVLKIVVDATETKNVLNTKSNVAKLIQIVLSVLKITQFV